MSEQGPPMGDPGREPTEEELRAAYEAELKRIRVEDIIVQTLVSLINLGGRRAGFVPGAEDERDLDQVRLAIEGVRALMPLVESELGPEAKTIREALAQLQMLYARLSGGGEPGPGPGAGPPAESEAGPPPPGGEQPPGAAPEDPSKSGAPGPAQRSGRLWIPGQ
ncbi:MAG: hypothetical protein QOH72_1171 [Solirubrobacteraceae bacterium]|nr:hypothetical protein [Solirubrobacteraceae bacterium]